MTIIAMTSANGGVGKSTVAANLAVSLTQRQAKVLVVDFDPQNQQRLHLGLEFESPAGLAREGLAPEAIFESPFGAAKESMDATVGAALLHFLPFGQLDGSDLQSFEEELESEPHWLAKRLHPLQSLGFDYVLIDTPTGDTSFTKQALNACDEAFVLSLPDTNAVLHLPEFEKAVLTQNKRSLRLINQMPTQGALAHEVRQLLCQDKMAQLIPVPLHRDANCPQALAQERPLLEFQPSAMLSVDYQHLADWFVSQYGL